MRPPRDLSAVSIANLTIGRMDPVRFVEEAAEAGFGYVGLALASATAQKLEHEIVGRPEVMRAVRAALQRTGTRVFDIEAFVLSPQASIGDYRRVLEAGAELGATHISAIGTERIGSPELLAPQQRIELFTRLCEEAARCGLHVGVEFMIYRDIGTVQDALALIAAASPAKAGVILDVLHIQRAGIALPELAELPPARIAYAQLCDAAATAPAFGELPTEARTGRLHPGEGCAPLRGFMDLLPDTTPLVVETPVDAEASWPTARRLHSAAQHTLSFFKQLPAGLDPT